MCLITEFPSNPLLRSPDLRRLRALADKYEFLVVVDETIGNFINVEVMPYADIVVSSLTKVFSGDANVMGGRFVACDCGYIHMHDLTFEKSVQPRREPSGSILPCLEGPAFVLLRRHVLWGGLTVYGTQFPRL
jgi:O-acetylhomoserine/O-acetylserine sulfhydrylase-like pyridoxal-dependent enzyme